MPQCYKNCAISVATHSLWLSIFTGWNKTLHGTRSTWRSHQLHKGVIFVHWYVCLCSGSLGVDVQMYCCWWWANLWILYQYISQMAAHLPGSLLKLTLYTITSVLIFFRLFFMHFLWCWQRKFVKQSKLLGLAIISVIVMMILNDVAVLLWGEIRCWSLVGGQRVNFYQWGSKDHLFHLIMIRFLNGNKEPAEICLTTNMWLHSSVGWSIQLVSG